MATSIIKQQTDLKADLLWTNPNPQSSYSNTDAVFNYTGYKFLNIIFRQVYSSPYMDSVVVPVNYSAPVVASTIRYDGTNNYNICRQFSVVNAKNRVGFAHAYRFNTYASAVEDDQFMIPQVIYGLK